MDFIISFVWDRKPVRLKISRILVTDRVEQYKVSSKKRSLILECNRPIFINRGLKHRRPDWKQISGDVPYRSLFETIIIEIEKGIKQAESK